MSKNFMIVLSNAKPGRDAEYMDWYEKVHLGEICSIPGCKNGHMYEVDAEASAAPPVARYMSIYELELDDPKVFLAAIREKGRSGKLQRSDAVDAATSQIFFYKQRF